VPSYVLGAAIPLFGRPVHEDDAPLAVAEGELQLMDS